MNSSSSLGRIPEIPVFRPTEEEFENFAAYVDRIEAAGAHHVGLAKVIPPAGWKPRSRGYEDVKERTIVSPTIQRVNGSKGCYTQYNLERKDMSVEQFEKVSKTS